MSLLTPTARAWSDGYLYSMVRYGRGIMPMYGDKIVRRDERWAVVGFLGTGRAWGNRVSFDDADRPVSGGLGFRYLIARRLGLYAGIDVAKMIANGKRAEEVIGHGLRANVIRSGPVNHRPKSYVPTPA